MLNSELIKSVLLVAVASSVFTTAVIQKVKECLNAKDHLCLYSFIISLVVGFLFAITFSTCSILESIWVGITSWVGASTIYTAFEDKIFKSYGTLNNSVTIEESNNIRSDDE